MVCRWKRREREIKDDVLVLASVIVVDGSAVS